MQRLMTVEWVFWSISQGSWLSIVESGFRLWLPIDPQSTPFPIPALSAWQAAPSLHQKSIESCPIAIGLSASSSPQLPHFTCAMVSPVLPAATSSVWESQPGPLSGADKCERTFAGARCGCWLALCAAAWTPSLALPADELGASLAPTALC